MKKIAVVFFCLLFFFSCKDPKTNRMVELLTPYGNIAIKLYDDTPIHRDNFVKLVKDSAYNGLLFHRVIQDFMIQGGDPDSKKATSGKLLGESSIGENLPAEILPSRFHKKGVIAAARESDQVNPERESSASQFYLVQGVVYTPAELSERVSSVNESRRKGIYRRITSSYKEEYDRLQAAMDVEGMDKLTQKVTHLCDSLFSFDRLVLTEAQRAVYTTIGGTPHLDGLYTVFGEIVNGLDVVDKIAAVETDEHDRPLKNIPMKIRMVKR